MEKDNLPIRLIKDIYTYWEGDIPLYIQKCLDSLEKICSESFTVHIITPKNINFYLNETDLNINYKELKSIAHKADCIRVAIMNKYGGIWVDADTVFINDPLALAKTIDNIISSERKEFFYMRWNDGRILNGYFICTKGNKITSEWLRRINNKLLQIERNFSWTEFGEQLLIPLVDYKFRKESYKISRNLLLPINIDKIPHIFFEPIKLEAFINEQTISIGLNHSFFVDNYLPFVLIDNEESLMNGTLLINDVMRRVIL